jgi:hypothetical protein
MTIFLAERNLPGIKDEDLKAAQKKAIATAEAMTREGTPIRYVKSDFTASSGKCVCMFEAPDVDAVKRLNDDAQLPYERIVEQKKWLLPGMPHQVFNLGLHGLVFSCRGGRTCASAHRDGDGEAHHWRWASPPSSAPAPTIPRLPADKEPASWARSAFPSVSSVVERARTR